MADIPVSVYTPTDSGEHLLDCYQSLQAQTYDLWEWVLVPNNGAVIPESITSDSRVRVIPHESHSIGELKRFAVAQSVGDLLVELDHDDLLTDDALATLVNEREETGAGFLYSDFVTFKEDKSVVYSEAYGWESYPFEYGGQEYTAMRSFDPTPEAMCHLQFSPNHVRAWSREAYNKAGGYDGNYTVADDYDLITRTYITGEKFHHIPQCLYLYRNWSGSRSIHDKNQEIQERQHSLSQARTYDMLNAWVRQTSSLHINLLNPRSTNVNPAADRNVLFDDIYRLPDSTAGRIDARNVLQFLPQKYVVDWMNHIYKKLTPGGWLVIEVPSTDGRAAFANPTYGSYWNEHTFRMFTDKDRAVTAARVEVTCRFHPAKVWTDYRTEEDKLERAPYTGAHLVASKGQRIAGTLRI